MTFVREETIRVNRPLPPILNKDTGRYTEQEPEEIYLRGNIQPTDGNEFDRLPEGIRYNDTRSLWLHEPLKENDSVIHKEVEYIIALEQDWDSGSSTIRHYKYIIMRKSVHL